MSAYWTCRGCGTPGGNADAPKPARACFSCSLENPWFIPGDETTSGGAKFDHGKPRWDLIPFRALASMVDVLTHGAKEYAPNNWRKVEGWRWRYLRAGLGHIFHWARGERLDQKTGLLHLAHAACNVFFLLELDEEQVEMSSAFDEPIGTEPRCTFRFANGERCTNRGVAEYDGFACAEHPLKRRGDSEV